VGWSLHIHILYATYCAEEVLEELVLHSICENAEESEGADGRPMTKIFLWAKGWLGCRSARGSLASNCYPRESPL